MRTLLALAIVLSACNRAGDDVPEAKAKAPLAPPVAKKKTPPDTRPVLICFGDSLTAGYGVAPDESFPALLQEAIDAKGLGFRVINAGQSGDTTAGGLDRLPQVLALKPAVVLLELGANDGLRGLPIAVTRANLDQIVIALQQSGAKVLVAGMTLPRNYGPDFIGNFEMLYRDLARVHKLRLVPFQLEPLAARGLLQRDGLHPTAEGYRVALPTILASLEPELRK